MKTKDIVVGNEYILSSKKKSSCGCAEPYFDKYNSVNVLALKKLNNYQSKNTIKIQVFDQEELSMIRFWCSAYDLKEVS